MEDRSMIKPILEALEYFSESEVELQFYYKIIDKFCARWFDEKMTVAKFTQIDFLLVQELLGEYIRFDSNSKKVALWILSLNRVCYNYTANLLGIKKELKEFEKTINNSFDSTLIEPIIKNIRYLEELHQKSGVDNHGEEDIIGDFLQWVGIYSSFVYPSLENKQDYYDKTIIKATNFLLSEFIKQKSNDKRLAFLILAILEACRHYSLVNLESYDSQDFTAEFPEGFVVPGTEENMVSELLKKLKEENTKQRQRPALSREILADQFIKDSFDNFIDEMNEDINESVAVFNNYVNELTTIFVGFDQGKQFLFIQTILRYRSNCKSSLKEGVHKMLRKSVKMLPEQTRAWFSQELGKLREEPDIYIDFVLQRLKTEKVSKVNTSKLFIMLYLIYKFDLID